MAKRVVIAALDPHTVWKRHPKPLTPQTAAKIRNNQDQQDLRAYWTRFVNETAAAFQAAGWRADLETMQRWEVTPERIDAFGADLAFVPHTTAIQYGPTQTPVYFYMQVMQRWLFTADPGGWGPATQSYPHKNYVAGDAASSVFDDYAERMRMGNISKFAQADTADRQSLVSGGEIPDAPYVFFPCQIPHDESLQLFSDIEEVKLVESLAHWANAQQRHIVFKEHPANLASMEPLRNAAPLSDFIHWSHASVHDLIREASAIYTMNSGVGFEALFYERPIVTFARAEYDVITIKGALDNLQAVSAACNRWNAAREMPERRRFIDWYCRHHALDLSASEDVRIQQFKTLVEDAETYLNQ